MQTAIALPNPELAPCPQEVDPLYLFACHMEWERSEDPGAGWELVSAAQSSDAETRSHARALLANSSHLGGTGLRTIPKSRNSRKPPTAAETDMRAPYGLEIIEDCTECACVNSEFFCGTSPEVLKSLNQISQKNTLPAGAILYVEGQAPRGMFIVCSGKVNLSTTSREGKILILKSAFAGAALGLSAAISGMPYETTAETATPCQVNFVDRKHFMELMEANSEIGVHAAQCLSRDYQSAYRDIHDLVLTRSSAGKLARLLLSQTPMPGTDVSEPCKTLPMTHEEMAQRIGSTRETVSRLLSGLRKKRLIRLEGPSLVIRDRTGLEALTV
jgi:CRP/FNR family transcriptional regulator